MITMDTRKLTAPCGLDCFNCELYIDNVTDMIRKVVSAKFNVTTEEAECRGCREQRGEKLGLPTCETYKCANEKGAVFCNECDEFPCLKLQPAKDGAERFPHNLKLYNLCRMKAVGFDEWAMEVSDIRKRYFKGKFVIGLGPIVK